MIDAVVMGRVGIDLYPNELETPLSEVRSFTRFVGGFAGNVATGLARLGVRTAIVSRVGAEGHGEYVRAWLASQGVDVRFLATDPYWLTPPTFCEVWPPDRFPLTFYRDNCADRALTDEDVARAPVGDCRVVFVTGTGLSHEPGRHATFAAAAAARAAGVPVVVDIDYRPDQWETAADFAAEVQTLVRSAVLFGSGM